MTILSAYAKLQDVAENTEATKDPQTWALYAGLAELAQGLHQELDQIKQRLDRLEGR